MPQLQKGEKIPGYNPSDVIEVIDYIAEGGQGEVYKVNYKGATKALKWYKNPVPPEAFYNNLANNINRGAPNEHFLWPLVLTAKYKGTNQYAPLWMNEEDDESCILHEGVITLTLADEENKDNGEK